MKNSDRAYIAGLIDGDGAITLRARKACNRYPEVSVQSTSLELIQYLKNTVGGTVVVRRRPRASNHSQAWEWRCVYNQALDLLRVIRPHLKEREKVRRADLLLNEYKCVTPRNGRYTKAMAAARNGFVDRFFEGNSRQKHHRVQHLTKSA